MKKTSILILIVAFILIGIVGISSFVLSDFQITGSVVKNYYTYTKAVCDDTNYCEDFEVTCENNEVISLNPTGAAVQFSDDWKDPRSKEDIERRC